MTTTQTHTPGVASDHSTARKEAWTLSPAGMWLVTQLELKQRVRSTKWKWSLLVVGLLIGAITLLVWAANHAIGTGYGGAYQPEGDVVFSWVVFFVLFLGLVVSPTLSATSINGDVKEGTLAPLQATGLSAIDIVLGKLLAAWIASLAFLAVALPFMVFGYFDGSLPGLAMVQVVVVLAVELLVVCALGLGWSALTAKTPASAVLTYVTVAFLTAILPMFFGLSMAVIHSTHEVTYRSETFVDPTTIDEQNPPEGVYKGEWGEWVRCEEYTSFETTSRTDVTWWMLAVNPYVIVADSSVAPGNLDDANSSGVFILGGMKQGVRELRLGIQGGYDSCTDGTLTQEEIDRRNARDALPPVWPWGLGVQALLAGGAVALGVRRVAVPYGKLPTGTRVA